MLHVHEAMFHCGKSMIRSHMWEPDLWGRSMVCRPTDVLSSITANSTARSRTWSRPPTSTRRTACTTNDAVAGMIDASTSVRPWGSGPWSVSTGRRAPHIAQASKR